MSTFRSRQRAAQRRQPIQTAERATPPAGNSAQPGPRGNQPFNNKPRSGGDARQDGRFAPRDAGFDKPRFGDKPRFDKPRDGFAPRGDAPREGGFDKPRFNSDKPRFDKPRDGFAPRGDAPREGGFDKPRFNSDKPRFDKPRDGFAPRGDAPREGGFDKPRFNSDKPRFDKPRDGFAPRGDAPREGGFDKPRFNSDKPRFDKPRDGFAPRGDAPREGGFDKPRFNSDKPRFDDRPRSFPPRGDAPREGGFDKPRFNSDKPRFDKPRDGSFAPRGDAPREGGFDKPRFNSDKPRFDKPRDGFAPRGDAPREGGFDKPRFNSDKPRFDKPRDGSFAPRGDAPREGGFDKPRFNSDKPRFDDRPRSFPPRDEAPRADDSPRNEAPRDDVPRFDKPRFDSAPAVRATAPADGGPKILFGNRKIEDSPAAPAATPAADSAASGEKVYTRDRVAGVRGKAHPDFQAPERREPAEPVRPKSFLKRRDDDAAPRREEAPRREITRASDEDRPGGFQRDRTFDSRGQERSGAREGGFQRDRTFDRHGSQPHGERKTAWQQDDRPRGERDRSPVRSNDGSNAPRNLFGKGRGQDDAANVGRTPYAKPVQHVLQEGQLALFASCPRGLEKLLADEIGQQGGSEVQLTDGGVHFIGSQEVMMRVNLHSRTASRLLMQLAQGSFQVERDIYTLAKTVDWPALFDVSNTIKVKTDGHARLRSIDYVSLIVKDAICDRFRELNDERPSVDTRTPDMRIRVFLSGFDVQIYLDTSGEALFKRGWRDETGEAPLRENLAAGILLHAGYNGTQSLLDPMCGSGTFLVEAADIALNRAPGRLRSFAFEKLNTHNDLLWHSIRNDAELAIRPLDKLAIHGNDQSLEMVEISRHNLARCGLEQLVTLSHGDATELAAPAAHGLITCNPPYGIRLDEQDSLAALYPRLATWLKHGFAGWTAHIMTADSRLPALMRLNADSRPVLYNGALECRVYAFPLVEGSNRKE